MARSVLLHHLLRSRSNSITSTSLHPGSCIRSYGLGKPSSFGVSTFPKKDLNSGSSLIDIHCRWASSRAVGAKASVSDSKTSSRAVGAKASVSDSKISIGPKKTEVTGENKDSGVVYYGPISSTIKKVKLLSLSTCCLSVSLGPVITFMTSPGMNVILKGAVASMVIFLSASTTGALHWFASPYVHKLKWQPGSDVFEVEMLSWLAAYVPRTIRFADVRPAETNRPYVTFKANGNFYYVDTEHFRNKALLARLTPEKAPQESVFKNL